MAAIETGMMAEKAASRKALGRPLVVSAAVLSAGLLAAALYLFLGALHTYGLEGTATIFDIYTKGLPACL